jgi:hypothetical protein
LGRLDDGELFAGDADVTHGWRIGVVEADFRAMLT